MDHIGNRTLRSELEEQAACAPRKEAFVFEYSDGRVERFSYHRFDDEVNGIANGLIAAGVRRQDKVALMLPNCSAFLLSWFACAKIGAVSVPVNTASTESELEYFLSFSGACLFVYDHRCRDVAEAAAGRVRAIEALYCVLPEGANAGPKAEDWRVLSSGPGTQPPNCIVESDDVAEMLFTSGSTAMPKGVLLTHANCLWSGTRDAMALRMTPADTTITALPLFHVNAQSLSMLAPLCAGATAIFLESYSASNFWGRVRAYEATVVSLLAILVRTLLAQPASPEDNKHRLRVASYALNCKDEEKEAFEERYGVTLMNGYGLTEAMVVVAMAPLFGARRWPSIGRPAFDRQVRLVDEDGADVPVGSVGEIIVKGVPGRSLMKGYHNDPAATAAAIQDGWLYTGDLARADEEGFLYFFDRVKDVIKRGGENVSASEVERVLAMHPDVAECAVIGVPDEMRDEAIKALVVPRQGAALNEAEVLRHCREFLSKFKVPSIIEVRASLPKTAIGKIEKKALREAREMVGATQNGGAT